MRNIFLCANAFKGTLTASEANMALREGLSFLQDVRFRSFPLADGGDGTLSTLLLTKPKAYKKIMTVVHGIQAGEESFYLVDKRNIAYIALCETSGLARTDERIPERRTTLGFGEQIRHALDHGIRDFVLFLGGSSTTDLGCGMLSALGIRFLETSGPFLPSDKTMKDVTGIEKEGFDNRIAGSRFTIVTDVDVPLLGEKGAVYRFAKQKGTREEDLPFLEETVASLSRRMEDTFGKKVKEMPGAGAAGGVGFACFLCLDAKHVSGAKAILDLLELPSRIKASDLVILGEGRIDLSSLEGKATGALARLCHENGIPFVTVSGSIEKEARERLVSMGLCHSVLLGEPSSQKAGNKDKIIKAVLKDRDILESLLG